jgi:two-component system phosphate regulon sensor histidine kinase PhoR
MAAHVLITVPLGAALMWFLWTRIERLGEPGREVALLVGLTWLVGYGVGIFLVAGVTWVLVSRPLGQLRQEARLIAAHEARRLQMVERQDELGALAQSVQSLSDQLKAQLVEARSGKELLETILQSMVEGVLVCDLAGSLVLVNRAAQRLLGLEDAKPARSLADLQHAQVLLEVVAQAAIVGAPVDRELTSPEGAQHLRLVAVPLRHEESVRGSVVVLHDVTTLRQLERVRRDFVANVSHELRTPLATITGYAETLLSGAVPLDPQGREFAEAIERHGKRLNTLVADLLTLARLEARGERLKLAPIALGEVVAEVLDGVHERQKQRGVKVHVDLGPRATHAVGEPRALRQVLRNLLENGILYTEAAGQVRLSSYLLDEGRKVCVEVRDTGVGIEAQHLPRIFERFYRVDPGRSRDVGGTGLGLAIVKHMVQAMEGQVEVESVPHKGSVFRVILPAAPPLDPLDEPDDDSIDALTPLPSPKASAPTPEPS